MVQNDLSEQEVREQAATLSFPQSVVEYFQGYLGIPSHGFPEELREKVLQGRVLPNGKSMFEGRPGAEMAPYDFEKARQELEAKYGKQIRDVDVMSHAIYPKVFKEFMEFKDKYGSCHFLDTCSFVTGMHVGQEVSFEVQEGKDVFVKLIAVGDLTDKGDRYVTFELNGRTRVVKVQDSKAAAGNGVAVRKQADEGDAGSVGAPMPGVVLEVKIKADQAIKAGDPLVVLSAMKMETVVSAPVSGKVTAVEVKVKDSISPGDLLCHIDQEQKLDE
mmetsp:Transcript_62535/g.150405  ORF Transcript_62535/g.150405 Transcript_62535/m.150405 type:complete len:274 (+) Transcript_62535:95-916(+)